MKLSASCWIDHLLLGEKFGDRAAHDMFSGCGSLVPQGCGSYAYSAKPGAWVAGALGAGWHPSLNVRSNDHTGPLNVKSPGAHAQG